MAFQISLFQIIFEEFLKISPDLISRYPTVQDQLLYLILIPHVLLLLFLLAFSKGIVKRFTGEHAKFRFLLGITAYIYIIWSGWYGTLFIPFFLTWFYIALGLAVFLFLISIVWHPAAGPAGGKLVSGIFETIGEKTIGRGKEIERLQEEIVHINGEIREAIKRRDRATSEGAKKEIQRRIEKYEDYRYEIEKRLRELGG